MGRHFYQFCICNNFVFLLKIGNAVAYLNFPLALPVMTGEGKGIFLYSNEGRALWRLMTNHL